MSSLKRISLDESESFSLSLRALPRFEHSDLKPVYPKHDHITDPKLHVMEFDNCLVNRYGFVKLKNNSIISDIGYRHNVERSIEHLAQRDVNDSSIASINEPVILINGHNNYYHWHLNWLPRIALADRFSDLRQFKILIHEKPAQYVLDSLHLVTGRTEEELLFLNGPNFKLSKVFIPTMFMNPMHAPFALRAYQPCRDQVAKKKRRRIYISRKKTKLRRVLNEEAVLSALEKYDFECIVSEDLSYKDQIQLFSDAEFVIGAHGAGLTNLLFCNPGFSTIELFNEYYTRVYWSLSTIMGGEHYKQVCSSNVVSPKGVSDPVQSTKNADFVVDVEKLVAEIEKIIRC